MSMDTETIIYIISEIVIGILVVVGNTIVCFVILHTPLKRKVMYIFVTSLSLADLCVGIIAVPFSILTKLGLPQHSPYLCMSILSLIMIPTQTSIFNLMIISIERYLAISHPRVHYAKVTEKRAHRVTIVAWIVASLIGILPLLGWNNISNYMRPSINGTKHVEEILTFDDTNRQRNGAGYKPITISPRDSLTMTSQTDHFEFCEFMKVMDPNYMLFNFACCVLPPLVTSAILYFVLFMNIMRSSNLNDVPLSSLHSLTAISPKSNARNQLISKLPQQPPCDLQLGKLTSCLVKDLKRPQSNNNDENVQEIKTELKLENFECNGVGDVTRDQLNGCVYNGKVTCEERKEKPLCKIESPSSSHHVSNRVENNELEMRVSVAASGYISNLCDPTLEKQDGVDASLAHVKAILMAENTLRITSKHNGQHVSYGDSPSSIPSTPAFMRSRAGTDVSLRTNQRHREMRHQKRKRDIHAAAVLAIIVLSFAICWMPIHVLNSINRFNSTNDFKFPSWLYSVAIVMSHTNSVVNFFLYSWRLKQFRKNLYQTLFGKCTAPHP